MQMQQRLSNCVNAVGILTLLLIFTSWFNFIFIQSLPKILSPLEELGTGF